MRTPLLCAFLMASSLMLPSCAGIDIAIRDHAEELTFDPEDYLFEMEFRQVPTPLTLDDLFIAVGPADKPATVCDAEFKRDANKDGMIDVGDVVLVVEPLANCFDPDDVKSSFQVVLLEPKGNGAHKLWRGVWMPASAASEK